ncbi:MAG: response regulator [Gammaproteobacteria bacterium]|nr:response regulator [Gammaproteobacteria bacterium]
MSGELIFVVDDDDAVRASLQALLETAGYRAAEFESGRDFLDSADTGQGVCVLLDVKMPGLDGLEVQRRLNDRGAELPVIIVTGHGDIVMAVQAMRAGAVDFLEKPVSRHRLLESVARAIAIGRDTRHDRQERSDIVTRLDALTIREHQVLERLVMGRSNKIVAYELGISSRTVEVYRRNVMSKMGANSLSHLVRMTLVAGMDPLGNEASDARGAG